jgi:hypothetical protein
MAEAETSTTLARMISGAQVARMISVVAELRIPDRLQAGPRSVEALAYETATHAPSLYRVLRALASVGIFVEVEGAIAQTPLSELLRSDIEGSMRGLALFQNDEWYWQIFRDLPYSVRTGQAATQHVWGHDLFEYFEEHPESARTFDEGMASSHSTTNAALAAACDFTGIATLADIGGGNGALLAEILARYPAMRGVLFDLPSVAAHAGSVLAGAGVSERCEIVGGDFFERVPSGADAYVLSNVLHDWQDDQAARILSNIRDAMPPHARVLVVNEHVLPTDNSPHQGKLVDIVMLLVGGRERTEPEWRGLFERAGLKWVGVTPMATRTGAGVLEGRRA